MKRTALAAVFDAPDQPLRLERFDAPDPVGAEILVRISGCTLCGSDLHTFTGRRPAPTPTILGHEIIGRIEALAPEAVRRDFTGQALALGDRVTWSIVASCAQCFYCQRSLPQKCERMVKYGHEPVARHALAGGLAEYCLLAPGTAVVRLPESLSDARACPANCATATAVAALRGGASRDVRSQAEPGNEGDRLDFSGRTVLVLGAGMLGLSACAMARLGGAAEVICCERVPERLERARAFGATRLSAPNDLGQAVAEATGGHGVDLVLEMTGSNAAFETALPLVRIGGACALVGAVFPSPPVPIVLEQLVRRQITLRGIHNYAPQDLAAAVRFLATSPQFPFEALVSEWFPLADCQQAMQAAQKPQTLRVGVRPLAEFSGG